MNETDIIFGYELGNLEFEIYNDRVILYKRYDRYEKLANFSRKFIKLYLRELINIPYEEFKNFVKFFNKEAENNNNL